MNAIDQASVYLTSAFFVARGFEVSATSGAFDTLDLIATKPGKTIGVECKGRTCPSDFYGDAIIDFNPKYSNAVAAIEAGRVDAVLVANTFADGILTLSILDHGEKTERKLAPATSHFANRQRIPKEFWRMQQERRFPFTSGADGIAFGRASK